jgi:hypothetical protein
VVKVASWWRFHVVDVLVGSVDLLYAARLDENEPSAKARRAQIVISNATISAPAYGGISFRRSLSAPPHGNFLQRIGRCDNDGSGITWKK